MKSLRKKIQLSLVFLKAPFLVLHFSYYASLTFLIMLSVVSYTIYVDDTTLYS